MDALPSTDPLDRDPLCCLVGPTASGKSALALQVAERAGAEILSLDSMLVYRGMDVGTAKPGPDERLRVRHHLVDLVGPSERYDVARWLADARAALADVRSRGARAFFVGGTGFYLAALLRGLFEGPPTDLALRKRLEERRLAIGAEAFHAALALVDAHAASRLHPRDAKRVVRALEVYEQTGRTLSQWQRQWAEGPTPRAARARLAGLRVPDAELDRRIRERAREMLDRGWLQEARALREREPLGPTAAQALGYAEVLELADGRIDEAQALERIALRTRRFARRQRTWYRKFPITWLDAPATNAERVRLAERVLEIFGWDRGGLSDNPRP